MTITETETRILADHPMCQLCTWTWLNGQFWLKYRSRMCSQHGGLK